MCSSLILIVKGFIIGVGKVIPGVSGSLLAISLGVYEKCICMINNLFKNFYINIIFLGKLAVGILLAIILGSRLIFYMLNSNYLYTMLLFIGLIVGTIPNILKEIKINHRKEGLLVILPILMLFVLEFIKSDNKVIIEANIGGYLYTIFLGFIDALTMIVPGISGTAIFILLGVYDFILNLFSNPFSLFIVFFGVGLLLGIIIVSKVIDYLFRNFKDKCYLFILGLILGTIFLLFKDVYSYINNISALIIGFLIFILGYCISSMFDS